MSRNPWLKLRKKTDPELPLRPPIRLGNFSNGEFFHEQTPLERRIEKEILVRADENARRLGLDRRDFLASAMGMATSLSVLNAASGCSSSANGGYAVPKDATIDCELAEAVVDGGKHQFIFDIQTHHIEEEGSWRTTNPGYGDALASFFSGFNGCTDSDPKRCVDAAAYLQKIFLESDTTLAVLSGFPAALCTDGGTTNCGNPLDNDAMAKSRDHINALAKSQRVIQHCQVNPTDHLDLQLAIMENIHSQYGNWGFKTYPEWGPDGKGWFLDDPNAGIPMIEKARELGSKIICIHKGIVFPGWDKNASHPKDVGVVAKMYPDTKFVVYHSAIEFGATGEDKYNPDNTEGTDRLIRTVLDNDLAGQNVYAELGSVWAQVMNSPDKAQHVIGKLLKYIGEDNVVWGSECIWFGSPQPQIQAFRAFQITKENQATYGYPELTDELKAKIFGLNAAKIYGINPAETRCKIDKSALAQLKRDLDGEFGAYRWAFQDMGGPRTRREFLNLWRHTGGRPG